MVACSVTGSARSCAGSMLPPQPPPAFPVCGAAHPCKEQRCAEPPRGLPWGAQSPARTRGVESELCESVCQPVLPAAPMHSCAPGGGHRVPRCQSREGCWKGWLREQVKAKAPWLGMSSRQCFGGSGDGLHEPRGEGSKAPPERAKEEENAICCGRLGKLALLSLAVTGDLIFWDNVHGEHRVTSNLPHPSAVPQKGFQETSALSSSPAAGQLRPSCPAPVGGAG